MDIKQMDIEKQTKEVKETAKEAIKASEEILSEKFQQIEAIQELKNIADTLKVNEKLQEESVEELQKMSKQEYFLIDIFRCLYVVLKKHEIQFDEQLIKKANIYPEMVVDEINKYIQVF